MIRGAVKWYNEQKGFGFITTQQGDVFVHAKELSKTRCGVLQAGDEVTLEIRSGERSDYAANVKVTKKAPALKLRTAR